MSDEGDGENARTGWRSSMRRSAKAVIEEEAIDRRKNETIDRNPSDRMLCT